MVRSHRNLAAGIANSLWSAAVGLAVVPLYLKYMGVGAYGLIAFYTSAQALLQLLDMGLVPTMNREVARCTAIQALDEARSLLHSLSIVYWITAGSIGILMAVAASLVSGNWFRAATLSQQTVKSALVLMAVVFACRWPIGIYQGAIMGAQRLVLTSAINMVMVTLSSFGAVGWIALLSPRIEVYFIWQAIVGVAYALAMRAAAWRVIGRSKHLAFDIEALRRVWRFSAGMSGVAISGTILLQLDKVILSRLLSLEAFGAYALAATLSSGLYILLSPTFNVIYPRLSAMVASSDTKDLPNFYRVGTRLLMAFLFPFASLLSFYSLEILVLWTHNPTIAAHAAPIVSIYILGTALNGAMHFPYALQLAYGMTKLPLTINLILLVFTVPTTILLAYEYGAIGGALSWAIINVLYVVVGTWLTHRSLLPGIGVKWLSLDVAVPLAISVILVGGASLVAHSFTSQLGLLLSCGILTCIAAAVVITATSAASRSLVFLFLQRRHAQIGAA